MNHVCIQAAYLAKFTHTNVLHNQSAFQPRARSLLAVYLSSNRLRGKGYRISGRLLFNMNLFIVRWFRVVNKRLPVLVQAVIMPYIMVMGSLSAPHLSKDEGATVYGLKSEERATLVRVINMTINNLISISKHYKLFVNLGLHLRFK